MICGNGAGFISFQKTVRWAQLHLPFNLLALDLDLTLSWQTPIRIKHDEHQLKWQAEFIQGLQRIVSTKTVWSEIEKWVAELVDDRWLIMAKLFAKVFYFILFF